MNLQNDFEKTVLKVLLVDDHQMFLDGLEFILSKEPYLSIVAEANNGKNALPLIKNLSVDMVITDISMPEMDGITLTKHVKQGYPNVKVLVLSMHNERSIVTQIMESEADGYVLKNCRKQELLQAIRTILDNGTYYCKEIASLIRENYKMLSNEEKIELTPREKEILQLIVQEYSSQEIADKLHISKRTVDTHRINIMEKTNSHTIVGLIKYAIRSGILNMLL
ncbi:MAG: response regulator transcription factor [Bacteroidia bacterium]|nr:response regulator transcription factor [Bacteroidia bacterium]MDW8346439.1 response regulator transcription factor [Bacteroidia bacterium]